MSSFPSEFHHIGLACRDVDEEASCITAFGYAPEGPAINDPAQKVRVQFFAGSGPRIELIAPLTSESPIAGILKRGTKFYHLAYEVRNFKEAIDFLEGREFRPVAAPALAVAFGMRRIVFMMARTGTLVELIEAA